MIFEALPARYGDCLLLKLESGGDFVRLLIDGGPHTVFKNFLQPRLEKERAALGLDRGDPLLIEAVMVSHVDEDHIVGILDFFGAMRQADDRSKPRPYDVKYLLHNSLDSLLDEGEGGGARSLRRETILAGLGGEDALRQIRPDFNHTALLVLQSYPQGSRLATLAAAVNVKRNPPDERTIMYKDRQKPRVMHLGDAVLKIVGPREDEVTELREKWQSHKKGVTSDADLAAYLDDSVPNLSSIVVLLECRGRTVLLTGDALGNKVLEGLAAAGTVLPLRVDILKLPHHGSIRNVDKDFFQKIRADHYVASGDGTFGNPDRETLEMLAKVRPNEKYSIHLTYSAASCDDTHRDWRKARPKLEPYSPAKHSLVGMLKNWPTKYPKITVHQGDPIKIEL
jgi:hypothetical protein